MIGEDHKRQRAIMLPGFGLTESRAFLPIFRECAESISMKWLETIGNHTSSCQTVVLNVRPWLSRGTLDAIGQGRYFFPLEDKSRLHVILIAAFDVKFSNDTGNDSHPLAKTYANFLSVFL